MPGILSNNQIPTITPNGLQVVLSALGASDDAVPDNLYDAIIVAIDFEGTQHILANKSLNRGVQVGLAILDTRDLTYLSITAQHCISTYNFAAGPATCNKKAERQFLFGTTVHITLEDMRAAIEACMPQYRNIILVGHDINNELIALRNLHFDFEQFPMDVIDTQWVAKEVGGFPSLQLRRVLQELDCPYERLHCAGNDAHFTLRALLLLAARACAGNEKEEHIRLWEDIAKRPIHPPKDPKKKKKCRPSWTPQDDIWAEYIREREAVLQQVPMLPMPYYYPAQPMGDVYMKSVFRENVCTDEWEVPGLMEDVYTEDE
ncbi:polynucleotidyl transferase [Aspergillus terreus]|uniref:Polynucleotidyl transferase n=1 Tax=Aspergillus terreus TaxID=33178 RepID=A0A5M3ZEJ3_ASPTE|nr:hypothetical protein ATETN484_0016018500 [Aspergillus terreus]GFF21614.1 polynucleotidyl transferase [Aspergillus terreus]